MHTEQGHWPPLPQPLQPPPEQDRPAEGAPRPHACLPPRTMRLPSGRCGPGRAGWCAARGSAAAAAPRGPRAALPSCPPYSCTSGYGPVHAKGAALSMTGNVHQGMLGLGIYSYREYDWDTLRIACCHLGASCLKCHYVWSLHGVSLSCCSSKGSDLSTQTAIH